MTVNRPQAAPEPRRIHWAADLVLAAVMLAATAVVAFLGTIVLNVLKFLALHHPLTVLLDVFGVAVMLVLLTLTFRSTRRGGYRVTPYATVAALPLVLLVGWTASGIPVIGR
ncbi:hypothetical protein ACFQ6N_14520 [Kitasatospora sp. NPDC056446]|uniref:hypothetical protein n=1 Tax=Kitasatospora sp. NPDC056446 TaxID=3345819 RepID=UPI0036B745BB